MTKTVAEGRAHNAIGLKRLTSADAEGEMHLLHNPRTMQGRQGCHEAWHLPAASASPKLCQAVAVPMRKNLAFGQNVNRPRAWQWRGSG